MEGQTIDLDQRIKAFVAGLKKDFASLIAEDQSGFRSRVVGRIRAALPRKRPGRRASVEVKRASEIYIEDYQSKGKEGNWHLIAKQVVPNYAGLQPEMRRLARISLRAATHSSLYEQRSRENRRKER